MTNASTTSPSFARFLTQLRATGREKLDGFAPSHFRDLTIAERDDARRLLTHAASDGDAIAALGLVTLDGVAAAAALRETLPTAFAAPTTARAMVLGALWRTTRDPAYADQLAMLAGDLTGPPASLRLSGIVRRTALVEFEDRPVTPAVLQVLRRAVREDPDRTVRSIAVGLLLYAAGLIPDVNEAAYPHMDLYRAIVEGDAAAREAAADRLDSFLQNT